MLAGPRIIGLKLGIRHEHVEDFPAVLVPARLYTAVTGDLELPARSWNALLVS